ncbi:hypothetical protein TKWG_13270 [Advenella kashmirensis WT001]|uniref:Uncharacterized protein n=1 Tax=Advenella kashmirensis (strain DSM 17095 / LMG 22695 / WT001) TaxID=1036672 RepID=I3UCP0_ADVKW|nr:hypothetical protein [Advenella kashmirensis]AFK62778.1 hypothetical protein TKWG_13270 [Advenella kashmirensis WT001]
MEKKKNSTRKADRKLSDSETLEIVSLIGDDANSDAWSSFVFFRSEEERDLALEAFKYRNNPEKMFQLYGEEIDLMYKRINTAFDQIREYKAAYARYREVSKQVWGKNYDPQIGSAARQELLEFLRDNPLSMQTQLFLCLNSVTSQDDIENNVARNLSKIGKSAIAKKLAKDPKQQEKQFIKECWKNWQADKSQYKSKAAFARDMMDKVEKLTSTKKVEDWCREWEKETITLPVQ